MLDPIKVSYIAIDELTGIIYVRGCCPYTDTKFHTRQYLPGTNARRISEHLFEIDGRQVEVVPCGDREIPNVFVKRERRKPFPRITVKMYNPVKELEV